MAEKNKKKMTRGKILSVFAVMLMLATAFAGLTFIGSTMIDEDTSAGGGSSSSPLDSLSMNVLDTDGTYYVKVGGTVSITPNPQSGGMHVNSVTSGYGLSCTTNGGTAKSLTGTISKAGTITCTVTNFAGTTSYSSFKIVGVVSEHTIQFNRGTHGSITYGGSTSQSMTVPDGTSCTISDASLTISGYGTVTGSGQSGYEAYGWSYTGGSGTATSGSFTITQNTTISLATRTVTSYTVTISAGTGGSVSNTSVSVPSGTSISTSGSTLTIGSNTITATANSGYSFSSWSNASGTVTANRTITANFVSSGYTVSFNGNGGSTPSSLSGTSITLPSSSRSSQTTGSGGSTDTYTWTTTTSYTFAGWYTSATGGSYVGSSGSSYTPTSNTTLYAHWNESSSTSYTYYYKIIYNANGGSGAPSTYTTSSSSSSASIMISGSTPTWSNHTFKGWATSSTAAFPDYYKSTAYTFSYGTTTLYAVWHQTATVQFNANGGSGAPSSMSDTGVMGSSYSFLIPSTTPTKSGYQFKGWATSSTATEPEYSTGAYISVQYGSTATLYAVWGLTTYYSKLFYNANGGTGAPATDTMSGQYSSQPSAANHYVSTTVPTWTNHTFLGWATSSTATTATYHANDTITVAYSTSSSAGTTLYAVWKSNTVTLSQPSQQYGVAGSSVSLSPVATADPSGATITYTATNVPSNLTVQINGSQVIMSSDAVGTYQFTLTAGATNYGSSSRTVTVEFVPQLVFENDPSAGQLAD